MDMAGERNANGDIPFSSVIFWGEQYSIPVDLVHFYWDVIKVSEGLIQSCQAKRSI
jgi:hypothetical protein